SDGEPGGWKEGHHRMEEPEGGGAAGRAVRGAQGLRSHRHGRNDEEDGIHGRRRAPDGRDGRGLDGQRNGRRHGPGHGPGLRREPGRYAGRLDRWSARRDRGPVHRGKDRWHDREKGGERDQLIAETTRREGDVSLP